jgi:hypothetical protein
MKTSKPTLGPRSSLFLFELIVLVVLSGCSGGSLTTREKGAGMEHWEVPVLEHLLELPLDALVLEPLLAESWG